MAHGCGNLKGIIEDVVLAARGGRAEDGVSQRFNDGAANDIVGHADADRSPLRHDKARHLARCVQHKSVRPGQVPFHLPVSHVREVGVAADVLEVVADK